MQHGELLTSINPVKRYYLVSLAVSLLLMGTGFGHFLLEFGSLETRSTNFRVLRFLGPPNLFAPLTFLVSFLALLRRARVFSENMSIVLVIGMSVCCSVIWFALVYIGLGVILGGFDASDLPSFDVLASLLASSVLHGTLIWAGLRVLLKLKPPKPPEAVFD